MDYTELAFESQSLGINGHFYRPDHALSVGAVMITGGAATAEELYSEWQAHLADAGIGSLSFDARGKGGSNGYWNSREAPEAPIHQINSQASRVVDTIQATHILRNYLNVKRVVVIGSSMGGDIAVHAASAMVEGSLDLAGLVLKSPAAYHPIAHEKLYGDDFTEVLTDHETYPPTDTNNFEILRRLRVPVQLIVAEGEEVILPDIDAEYRRVVAEELVCGEVVTVGDETTRHTYFSASDETSRQAKQDAIDQSREFILKLAA